MSLIFATKESLADDNPFDNYDADPEIPTVDMEEEDVERLEVVYPTFSPEETVLISGPLPLASARSPEDEKRRMSRRDAATWARQYYGKENVVEMVSHPQRWVARVKKAALRG